jgi:hypothetical protein
VARPARALVFGLLATAGCLENLHQEKYFAKLAAADAALFERVDGCRDEIERELEAALTTGLAREVEHIGYFGETADYVNTVVDGDVLFMRGRIRFTEGKAARYFLAFRVHDGCGVQIEERRVFE